MCLFFVQAESVKEGTIIRKVDVRAIELLHPGLTIFLLQDAGGAEEG